ncbi:MAG: hypothetical protein IMZ52_01360 [Actinobacteria bacterium]|nr:hypothetical protein [Actinomycetota bacterium]
MKQLAKITIILLLLVEILMLLSCSQLKMSQEKNQQNSVTASEVVEKQENSSDGYFSKIEITSVDVSGDKVTISGKTDLPEGALIFVDFDVWGRLGSDLDIGVSVRIPVYGGEFKVTLDIPQREEFKNGPYEVSVLFTPRNQSAEIINAVGENGEKLEGELVEDVGGFKILNLEEKRDLQLTTAIPTYTFQMPDEFSQESAEYTLAMYILAWKNQDWDNMANFAQETWLDSEEDPAATLEAWYDFKTLKDFEILDIQKISSTTANITFVVQYEAITNQISKMQITAKVIKESDSYTPSEQGQWGVNPISALKEKDID